MPARGTQYENIFINDIITTGDYISMFTGGSVEKKSSDNATKEQLSALGNKATIKYFANGIENNKLVVLKLDNKKEIRAFFDKALQNGEIKSQAQDFQTTADKIFANATRGKGDGNGTVKSFSPKLVHQKVCFNEDSSHLWYNAKAYDFEGNTYLSKEVGIGSDRNSYYACNTVPTEVPVKAFVTFKQILPSVKGLKFASILTKFGPTDGWDREVTYLELSDLVIDWK